MGTMNACMILLGKPERNQYEGIAIGRRIILKRILNAMD
jgi:hypothetical protein